MQLQAPRASRRAGTHRFSKDREFPLGKLIEFFLIHREPKPELDPDLHRHSGPRRTLHGILGSKKYKHSHPSGLGTLAQHPVTCTLLGDYAKCHRSRLNNQKVFSPRVVFIKEDCSSHVGALYRWGHVCNSISNVPFSCHLLTSII